MTTTTTPMLIGVRSDCAIMRRTTIFDDDYIREDSLTVYTTTMPMTYRLRRYAFLRRRRLQPVACDHDNNDDDDDFVDDGDSGGDSDDDEYVDHNADNGGDGGDLVNGDEGDRID